LDVSNFTTGNKLLGSISTLFAAIVLDKNMSKKSKRIMLISSLAAD
jgi:hypothetical protein